MRIDHSRRLREILNSSLSPTGGNAVSEVLSFSPSGQRAPVASSVEPVVVDGCTLAVVLRRDASPAGSGFVSAPDDGLQMGVRRYRASEEVAPHVHQPIPRHLRGTCEFLLVRSGHCAVDVYDDAARRVAEIELREGDGIMLLAGGHGVRMLADTSLLEIKQGPYGGPAEKRPL
jgi:hypothetical protein